jgi:dinuclear metal center YbgI/SA1388 family protein
MPVMLHLGAILEYLEAFAPLRLAAEWDNVGLLLGDRNADVQRVMTCLTVTPESAAEAVAEGAQLIVAHHPILFRPIQRLTGDTPEGLMLTVLVKAGIAVYSPHTAFDNTKGGINDLLAHRLGVVDAVALRRQDDTGQCKVVVFLPEADLGRVSDALFAAGAGNIGQYSQCSFRAAGTGTFFGSDTTNPTVGQKGRREEVAEWRVEVICAEAKADAVVAALRKAHSYEEPAFDIYPLRPRAGSLGEGRLGRLSNPCPLREFAASVKNKLNAGHVQTVGELNRRVEHVAIVCGAGGAFLNDAMRAQADVFLTGEARFHDCLAAQANGLALVLPGHYATERCGVELLAEQLQARWPTLQVWASRRERDPLVS